MKILRGLRAMQVDEADWRDPHGQASGVYHVEEHGKHQVVRKLLLGPAGLQTIVGTESAVIPMDDLVALFESVHPALKLAPPPNRGGDGSSPAPS
jgi:hypothetical protein